MFLMSVALRGGGTQTASSVTWSATVKNANVTLTNGGMSAGCLISSATNYAGRSDTALSGKKYFEVKINTGDVGGMAAGIGNASETFANGSFLGNDTTCIGAYGDGNVYNQGISQFTGAAFADGDVVCVAVDTTAAKIWWRKNGGTWNNDILANQNPATGAGGVAYVGLGLTGAVFPAYNVRGTAEAGLNTATFAAPFTFIPPAGFTGLP